MCEKFCACRDYCSHTFKGCTNRNKCIDNARKCDIDFCFNIIKKNDKEANLALAKSIVCNGYGVFAVEDIDEDQIIGEYLGEMLKKDESDRRTVFNECLDLNYLFTVTDSLDIDAYKVGNFTRYINHAAYGYQNCSAGSRFVNGSYKIFIFAMRDIKKGEELFFDYMFGNKIKWVKNYNILHH
jgi:hypothetical protein